jgi:hypothetical protein
MVVHDGPGPSDNPKSNVQPILDNLIAQKRIPHHRHPRRRRRRHRKDYDTMAGVFADYIEAEVLPRVEKNRKVRLTKDADGRAAMGNSSGWSGGAHHGLVPQGPLPPRVDDLGQVREPGLAVRPQVPRRCLGVPRDARPRVNAGREVGIPQRR